MSDNPFETGSDLGDVSAPVAEVEKVEEVKLEETKELSELEVLHKAMLDAQAGRDLDTIPIRSEFPDPYWEARNRYQLALHKAKG